MPNSKTFSPLAVLAIAVLAVTSSPAVAQQSSPLAGDISANVGLFSDYAFRGVSQTDEDLAVQGGVDYGFDNGFYAGAWGSNIDFGDDADIEVDYYGGYGHSFAGIDFDAGVTYYSYPGSNAGYNFIEANFGLGFEIGQASFSARVNYSPDNFGGSGDAVYISAGVEVPVPIPGPMELTLAGGAARQLIQDEAAFGLPDYYEWNFGATLSWTGFDFGVTYRDTDIGAGCAACAARVIFSIGRSF